MKITAISAFCLVASMSSFAHAQQSYLCEDFDSEDQVLIETVDAQEGVYEVTFWLGELEPTSATYLGRWNTPSNEASELRLRVDPATPAEIVRLELRDSRPAYDLTLNFYDGQQYYCTETVEEVE